MKHTFSRPPLLALIVVASASLPNQTSQAQTPYAQSRSYGVNGNSGFGRPSFSQSRPSFSPYLNLLRGGNSTLFNYYGLVRPEQSFRQFNSQVQQNFGQLQHDVGDLRDPRYLYRGSSLQASGHRARFFGDLYGNEGSFVETLGTRRQALETLPSNPYSHRPPTGHGAWFGNRGSYFPSQSLQTQR